MKDHLQDTIGMSLDSREELRLASQQMAALEIPGYTLKREIGRGTFGVVWEAVREQTGQQVAIKLVARGQGLNWDYFGRELAFLRDLEDHPYTLTVLDADLNYDPPFIVTPLVEGGSLEQIGNQRERDMELCQRWIGQLAEALSYIHARGVIHCDLKPSNVFLSSSDSIRVGDFGQSRRLLGSEVAWGTLGFMAPEQCIDDPDQKVNPSVGWDVYGFGATAYWLLTGQRARISESDQERLCTMQQVSGRLSYYRQCLHENPLIPIRTLNPKVHPELAAIIEKCLEVDPEQRTQNINVVVEDLRRWRDGEPLFCRRPWSFTYRLKVALARREIQLMTLLVLLSLIGGYNLYDSYRLRWFNFHTSSGLHARESGRLEEAYLHWLEALKYRPGDSSTLARLSFLPVEMTFPHQDTVNSLAFLDDGKVLATGSSDSTVVLWHVESGDQLDRIAHDGRVGKVVSAPGGQLLATASWDGKARLYSLQEGKVLRSFAHPEEGYGMRDLAFSADGAKMVTASDDGSLRLWRVEDGATLPLQESPDAFGLQQVVAFHPQEQFLAAIWNSGQARLWDTKTGQPLAPLLQHDGEINALKFSADGKLLVTASDDRSVKVWSVPEGKLLSRFAHESRVHALALNGQGLLATGADDGLVRVWRLSGKRKGEVVADFYHRRPVRTLDFAPGGKRLGVGTGEHPSLLSTSEPNGTVYVWDVETGLTVGGPWPHDGPVTQILFHSGEQVATASGSGRRVSALYQGTARLWHLQLPQQVVEQSGTQDLGGAQLEQDNSVVRLANGRLVAHGEKVVIHDFAVSPDGSVLATASQDRTLRLWDAVSGRALGPPLPHDGPVTGVCFSPDSEWVASASEEEGRQQRRSVVRIWEAETGMPISEALGCSQPLRDLFFTPDGTALIGKGQTSFSWSVALPSPGQKLTESITRRLKARLDEAGAVVAR